MTHGVAAYFGNLIRDPRELRPEVPAVWLSLGRIVTPVCPHPISVVSGFMVQHDEFEVAIPSQTGEGQMVQERIIALLEQRDYPMRDVFGVRLALEEALVNAIKHGNGMDPDKKVHIECRVDAERVWVRIRDEGQGFDLNSLPDPTLEENLEKPSGRGVLLMREFMTHVEYNDRGNCVTLEKRRDTPAAD